MFKVVPDQLKISDGWVRCGHCADVFDATLYLQTWEAPAPEPQPAPAAAPAAALESSAGHPFGMVPVSVPSETANDLPTQEPLTPAIDEAVPQAPGVWDPSAAVIEDANELPGQTPQSGWLVSSDLDDGDWLLAPPAEAWSPRQEAQDAADWKALQVPVAPPFDSPFAPLEAARALAESGPLDFEGRLELANQPESPAVASRDDSADFQAELKRFAAAAAGASRAVEAEVKTASPPPAPPPAPAPAPKPERVSLEDKLTVQEVEPGFVLQARRQAFWRSPGMRTALLLLAVALAALLAAQWAVQERDQLAARQPSLVPLLNLLCEPSGCVLQAPRNIDAVVIDSSTLVRRLGNFYSFDLVLKNSASTPVAMPALELSLTDTADAVITRRVFLAEELPGAPAVLPAQSAQAVSLRLSLAEGGASAMAGYRALVFYP
jgi:predicted Zn finger-like uncharacterized protein